MNSSQICCKEHSNSPRKREVSDSWVLPPTRAKVTFHFRSDYKRALHMRGSISICSPVLQRLLPEEESRRLNAAGAVNISVGWNPPCVHARRRARALLLRLQLQLQLLWCQHWTPPLGGAPCSIFGECIILVQLSCLFLLRWRCSTVGTLRGPGETICSIGGWSAAFSVLN